MINPANIAVKSPTGSIRSLVAGASAIAVLAAGMTLTIPTPASARVCAHLGNGVAICFGGDRDGARREFPIRQLPARPVRALPASVQQRYARRPLPRHLQTADGDLIDVNTFAGPVSPGPVRLCLETKGGMWKKDIQVVGYGTLHSQNGTKDCLQVRAGFVRLHLIKAKFAGVMTGVGYASMNLQGWGNSQVIMYWARD